MDALEDVRAGQGRRAYSTDCRSKDQNGGSWIDEAGSEEELGERPSKRNKVQDKAQTFSGVPHLGRQV